MAITTTHSRMIGDLDAGSTYATTASLGTAAPLNVGTAANNVVQLDGTAKLPAVDGSALTGISSSAPVIVLRDERASATEGGTPTAGSWNARTLQTEVTDTGNHCSLSANQFTLSAGSYEISASASFYRTNMSAIRLYNTTGASELVRGNALNIKESSSQGGNCLLFGYFTVTASQALELQYRVNNAHATYGLGVATGWDGTTEIFTQVMLSKSA